MRVPFSSLLLCLSVGLGLGLAACGSRHSRLPFVDDGGPGRDDGSGGGGDSAPAVDAEPEGVEPLECGDSRGPLEVPPEPIVNGTDSFDPSIVDLSEGQVMAIGAMGQGRRHLFGFCTGALIAPNLVLTAAHCVDGFVGSPGEISFVVGEDWSAPIEVLGVSDVYVHPEYRAGEMVAAYDVGLVRLSESATEAVPGIEPLPVNCEELSRRDFLGQFIQAVGFGSTVGEGGDPWDFNTLRWWTLLDVVSLLDESFTVDGFGENGVCNGDSGGPALWTMPDGVVRIVGVVSVGEEGCVDRSDYATTSSVCDFVSSVEGPCEGVTAAGECSGNAAIFCEDGEVRRDDCEALGLVCADVGAGYLRCAEPPDPCGGETVEGRCEGDLAIWCDGLAVSRLWCPEIGSSCAVTDAGYARCVEDPCSGLSWEGLCDGDTATWCEGGELRRRRCDDCLQRCGWSEAYQAFYCL